MIFFAALLQWHEGSCTAIVSDLRPASNEQARNKRLPYCPCRENEELIAKLSVPPEGSKDLFFKSAYPQSQLKQTRLLLQKDLITYWRSPNYNSVRFVFTVILALIVGAIYWDLGSRRC